MPLTVTYSYWDGTGHRRRIQVLRGSTVGEFLELARKELEREFVELRCVAPENLMYVKEDLILPHVSEDSRVVVHSQVVATVVQIWRRVYPVLSDHRQ